MYCDGGCKLTVRYLTLVACTATVAVSSLFAVTYPLDPLSLDEMQVAADAVKAAIDCDSDWLFDKIELLEPTKASMIAFKNGGAKPDRKALVAVWNRVADEYYDCEYNFDASSFAGKKNRMWVIENTDESKKTCLGYHPGYAIVPQTIATPMLKNCARIVKRATYLRHLLYVVQYKEGELDSLGKYPCEAGSDKSPSGVPDNKGLGYFVDQCEDNHEEGYDTVVYYAMGHLHSPHPEQNPIMPVETISFVIQPHAFFNENPAMDVDTGKFTSNACP